MYVKKVDVEEEFKIIQTSKRKIKLEKHAGRIGKLNLFRERECSKSKLFLPL